MLFAGGSGAAAGAWRAGRSIRLGDVDPIAKEMGLLELRASVTSLRQVILESRSPSILHPTTYTLHPTPYTLLPSDPFSLPFTLSLPLSAFPETGLSAVP